MEFLQARYDRRKSFYNKAKIIRDDDSIRLQSYDTIVAEIKDKTLYIYGKWSQTTTRHQLEFIKQFTNLELNSKDIYDRVIKL